jgi:hypothetical protein
LPATEIVNTDIVGPSLFQRYSLQLAGICQ